MAAVAPQDSSSPTPAGPAVPALGLAVAVLTLATLALRCLAVSTVPEQLDSISFLRAMSRYSLAASAPHWPGYPVYVGAAKLATLLTGDAVTGLHLVSVAASALTQIPLMLMTADWARAAGGDAAQSRRAAVATGLFWMFVWIANTTGLEIISDPMAAAAGGTLLWLSWTAYDRGSRPRALLALALAGVLPGIRLPALMLAGPAVLCAWWLAREGQVRGLSPARALAAAAAPVALWSGWQFWHEGSALFTVGRATVDGHMRNWGGSVVTDPHPFLRPGRMLETFSTFGIGGWTAGATWPRHALTALLGALALAGVIRLARAAPRAALVAAAWIVPYLSYHLVIQTVDLPRYQLAPVALVCVLAGVGLPGRASLGTGLAVTLAVALATVTIPAARVHARVPPVEYQFAAYGTTLPAGSVVLVVEDSRALQVFTNEFAPRVVLVPLDPTAVEAQALAQERLGHIVYATQPAPDRPDAWTSVARFCTDVIFDGESLTEVWLFRHQPGADAVALPGCAHTR
jgi:hypothetical protein